jgi:hypothetical protein
MIQNYDKFSKWNVEFGRIYTLWKMNIYSKLLTKDMWSIGAIICTFNNNLQKISIKKTFHRKKWKWLKKNSQSFVK